jgi:hypothetical protein
MVNPAGALQLATLVVGRGDGKLTSQIEPAGGEFAFKQELELDANAVPVIAQHGVDNTLLLADAPEAFTGARDPLSFPASAGRVKRLVSHLSVTVNASPRWSGPQSAPPGENREGRIPRAADA